MDYIEFLKTKQKRIIESGFEVKKLNDHLFPFQEFIVMLGTIGMQLKRKLNLFLNLNQ